MSTDQVIHLEKVNKWYDDFHVLKDIDLIVNKGQKIVICGPSGSGKSTMIRCINRLEAHQKGTIVVHGTELTNDLKNIDLIRKNVGMVFQDYALFPAMTVRENIAFGVRDPGAAAEAVNVVRVLQVRAHRGERDLLVPDDLLQDALDVGGLDRVDSGKGLRQRNPAAV
mgnify:CR=1 FL=1